MQNAIEAFGQDAEDADLRLVDDRLLEVQRGGEVAPGVDSLDPEEVPRLVRQVARIRLEAPPSQVRERDPLDVAPLRPTPFIQPAAGGGSVREAALRGQGRGQESGPVRVLDWLRPAHQVDVVSCTSRRYSSHERTTCAGL